MQTVGFQIHWPAPVEWREECNWAGKDIAVSQLTLFKLCSFQHLPFFKVAYCYY